MSTVNKSPELPDAGKDETADTVQRLRTLKVSQFRAELEAWKRSSPTHYAIVCQFFHQAIHQSAS